MWDHFCRQLFSRPFLENLAMSNHGTIVCAQDWLTPANKKWPGSGRVNEVYGDRNVMATLYGKTRKVD